MAFRPKAYGPKPADGANDVTQPLLLWEPGSAAIWHDVYLGTTPDLTDADRVASRIPFALHFHASGLVPGVTYYWRIDEIAADGTLYEGDLWTFTAMPIAAFTPSPADGAENIFPAPTLSWSAGLLAAGHQIYFSSRFADVNDGATAADRGTVAETTFAPGPLRSSTAYYWRVDEIQADGSAETGPVWTFTTADGVANKIVRQWWSGIGGTAIGTLTGHADYPNRPTGTEWLDDFEGPVDWADNYGQRLYGWLTPPETGEYTFWISGDDAQELHLSTDADPANATVIARVATWTTSRQWDKEAGQESEPIQLQAGQKYFIQAIGKEASGGDSTAVAWQGGSIATQTILSADYVDTFALPALQAFGPTPADGAVDTDQAPLLSWTAGEKAVRHEVYLGQDEAAVAAADTSGSLFQGRQNATTFDAGALEWGRTYYWRIDEISDGDPESPWIGNVWRFTTADYIRVEDFESYTDNMDAGEAVFQTWVDGIENGTGAIAGYLESQFGTFGETSIVHGGQQSMPFDYDNVDSPWYSEAYRDFTPSQDWTAGGVSDLSLWFRGNAITFMETGPGAITMSSTSGDVWTTVDHFRYVYRQLSGDGSIVARVDSMTDTAPWAKGGVMIREALDPSAAHVLMMVAPNGRTAFQNRLRFNEQSFSAHGSPGDLELPAWIKLERKGNELTGYYSTDGVQWVVQSNDGGGESPNPILLNLPDPIYIGLVVTSNNMTTACVAEFSEIATTGNVSGQWQAADVGPAIPGNDIDSLYVAIEDSAGIAAVVTHPDPAAVTYTDWTEWKIPLSEFAGVNPSRVSRVYIGVGDRDNPTPDGVGRLYFDDVRVVRPAPVE